MRFEVNYFISLRWCRQLKTCMWNNFSIQVWKFLNTFKMRFFTEKDFFPWWWNIACWIFMSWTHSLELNPRWKWKIAKLPKCIIAATTLERKEEKNAIILAINQPNYSKVWHIFNELFIFPPIYSLVKEQKTIKITIQKDR